MRKLSDGEILDTIIMAIEDNSPDGMCRNCPVFQLIKDTAEQVSKRRRQEIAKKMEIAFSPNGCPCLEIFKDRKQ